MRDTLENVKPTFAAEIICRDAIIAATHCGEFVKSATRAEVYEGSFAILAANFISPSRSSGISLNTFKRASNRLSRKNDFTKLLFHVINRHQSRRVAHRVPC